MKNYKGLTKKEKEMIHELILKGFKTREISKLTNVPVRSISTAKGNLTRYHEEDF